MKKAKIILASLAILAVVGGALAFKANRVAANVWTFAGGTKLSSIVVGTLTYSTTIPNCTLTNLVTTNFGPTIQVSTTTTSPNVTTIFTRQGGQSVTTTYHFCTTILRQVEPANS